MRQKAVLPERRHIICDTGYVGNSVLQSATICASFRARKKGTSYCTFLTKAGGRQEMYSATDRASFWWAGPLISYPSPYRDEVNVGQRRVSSKTSAGQSVPRPRHALGLLGARTLLWAYKAREHGASPFHSRYRGHAMNV
ncbi:hypothetical protein L1887_43308 [Cichorium endivia]|nr:hypothetical protein L1887_43308 [Cichorium endivia]